MTKVQIGFTQRRRYQPDSPDDLARWLGEVFNDGAQEVMVTPSEKWIQCEARRHSLSEHDVKD